MGLVTAFLISGAGCTAIDIHFDDRMPTSAIQTVWRVQLDEPEAFAYRPKQTASPAYGANGRVVIAGSDGGELVAADTRTGRVRWRFDTHGKIRGAPAVTGDAVFFGATDGKLYRLELKTGSEDWDQPYSTKGAITSAPAVGGGKVVFQNNQNRTYAVDEATGQYLWDQGRARPAFLTIKGEGGATIDGDAVYAGYDDGFLVKMRLEDGATVWSKSLAAEQREFIDVDSLPLVRGDMVYASCFGVGLYAVGKKHGNIKWLHRARGASTPARGPRHLYITTGNGKVRALEPATGKKQWEARFDYAELADPVYRLDRLWVPTGDGLLQIDTERGAVLSRISADYGQTGRVATFGSWLHMVTNSGALVGARIL